MTEGLEIDPVHVLAVGDSLVSHAGALRAGAGGVDRSVPDVPYDWFDLRHRIVRLDEAREAFNLRMAAVVDKAAATALEQAFTTHRVDGTAAGTPIVPLPRVAR